MLFANQYESTLLIDAANGEARWIIMTFAAVMSAVSPRLTDLIFMFSHYLRTERKLSKSTMSFGQQHGHHKHLSGAYVWVTSGCYIVALLSATYHVKELRWWTRGIWSKWRLKSRYAFAHYFESETKRPTTTTKTRTRIKDADLVMRQSIHNLKELRIHSLRCGCEWAADSHRTVWNGAPGKCGFSSLFSVLFVCSLLIFSEPKIRAFENEIDVVSPVYLVHRECLEHAHWRSPHTAELWRSFTRMPRFVCQRRQIFISGVATQWLALSFLIECNSAAIRACLGFHRLQYIK